MGGQACVFYGAAEFSRDCDIVILPDQPNYCRLTAALDELQAECIAVPPLDWRYLDRGHAIHFRCLHPDAHRIRLDVMTKMRGCEEFSALWERRTTLQDNDGTVFELLSIEDLVKAKKTQRDKDWPMIRRLVDAHYAQFRSDSNDERIRFWLSELRSPETLIGAAAEYASHVSDLHLHRPLLKHAIAGRLKELRAALIDEQTREGAADEAYWRPLKAELEQLRRERHK